MKRFNDLTSRKFGDLRVLAYAGVDKHQRRRWRVSCECCGYGVKVVLAANLLSGRTKNCGCIQRYKAHERIKGLTRIEKFFNLIAPEATEGWESMGAVADGLIDKLNVMGLNGEAAWRQFEAEIRAQQPTTTKR